MVLIDAPVVLDIYLFVLIKHWLGGFLSFKIDFWEDGSNIFLIFVFKPVLILGALLATNLDVGLGDVYFVLEGRVLVHLLQESIIEIF